MLCLCLTFVGAPSGFGQASRKFFGFDRNEYPGDAQLSALHSNFAFAGFWLNNPFGADHNSWSGKRAIVRADGFGFLILWNGRLQKQLGGKDAAALGGADGTAAVAAAKKEGFPAGAVLFLDQEEGGRLTAEQGAYLFAWIAAVRSSAYRPGVYCSGIPVNEGSSRITTAAQILAHEKDRPIALWVVNDSYPPSPGCVLPQKPFSVGLSGIPQALVWQYARSPRTSFAGHGAAGYAADKQCYAPGLPPGPQTFVDLNVSPSEDPSRGR